MVTGQSAMIKYWVTPITLQPNFNNSHKICTYCPFYVVPYIRINKGQRWLNKHGHFLIKICLLSAKKVCILSLWLGDARPKVEDVGCSVPALHQIDKFFEYFWEQLGHSCPRFEGHLIFFTAMWLKICSSVLGQTRLQACWYLTDIGMFIEHCTMWLSNPHN